YEDAPLQHLPRGAARAGPSSPVADSALDTATVPYSRLYEPQAAAHPINRQSIGEFLRCSMGLSAWKQYGQSRWSLRVNPSSGNLHPTEAWIVHDGRVWHYAPHEHALEQRCVLDVSQAGGQTLSSAQYFLVGLTSIVWRETWK